MASKKSIKEESKNSKEESKKGGTKAATAAGNKKPPSSKQGRATGKEAVEEEDTGDTFLTDMLNSKNRPRAGSSTSAAKNKKQTAVKQPDYDDKDSNVDSDEYQDVVYDVEQTQALMDMADDFLHQPMLSLPAPGDENKQNQSQMSLKSNMTGMTNVTSKNYL